MNNYAVRQQETLAAQFAQIAVGLSTSLPSAARLTKNTTTMTAEPPPQDTIEDNAAVPVSDLERVRFHPLACRIRATNATAIYEEYHGIGDFNDVPAEGGLKSLDEKWGTKWRSGDAGYQKAYSRMQLVLKGVDLQVKAGKELVVVLNEFDALFAEKNCKTMDNMVVALQNAKLLPKRERSVGQRPAMLA